MSKPLFSICHTSARPDKWRAVFHDWMSKAVNPENVEYVLCVDPRWGFSLDADEYAASIERYPLLKPAVFRVCVNEKRRCYVDGVNTAAGISSGSILIVNADDQFACEGWDEALLKFSSYVGLRSAGRPLSDLDLWDSPRGFVIEPSTGTPEEHERGILPMPILSRQRYEDQGSEVFYHLYESMWADNDFCEHARQDGVIIDARHLLFPHRHAMIDPATGGWKAKVSNEDWDQAYRVQNRKEAADAGAKLIARRRTAKFAAVSEKRCIAMCYPGERFEGAMVDSLIAMYAHLALVRDFEVLKIRSYTSDPAQTREEIRRTILNQKEQPDLVLCMDDDNPLRPDQFDRLLSDLDAHPEVDGIAGWCWIFNEDKKGFMPSCGEWAPDRLHWNPFSSTFTREIDLRPFECGGMPCILLRMSAFEKAGEMPFLRIQDNRLEHGALGEDFSFFRNAEDGGAKFLVDPRVRVPHLKYVSVEPVLQEEGAAPPVKVACMMRVKNEARWIKRVIAAVKPLCGEHIYVMEDGSTDDTVSQALAAGAVVLGSPFEDQGLNEVRDKNWLLGRVREFCPDADWILMPDGDEELEPGGCDKIRMVLEGNPNVDCFSLRIINLWDSIDQARFDGCYGKMGRQSLFRATSPLEFRSYYEGTGENRCGLHCSNAPGVNAEMRLSPLGVSFLHYGALHREDRIRKYLWITALDPGNEAEDCYRHMIQGDIPDVPGSAKLTHAGPLELKKLPAHLVPKFEGEVPGPLLPRGLGEWIPAQFMHAGN